MAGIAPAVIAPLELIIGVNPRYKLPESDLLFLS